MKQMDFVNTNTEEFHGVWVYCEQRLGRLMSTDLELISEGRVTVFCTITDWTQG